MAVRRFVVPVAVNGSGAATVYSPYLSGKIETVQYVKTDFADGVDFTITAEGTTEGIWTELDVNSAVIKHPRAATHTILGAAAEPVTTKIGLSRDRVKIVIASGGVSKTGSFTITVSD